MNCRQMESLLSQHLDGRLPEATASAFTAHLLHCPVCRRHLDELHSLRSVLHSLGQTPAPDRLEQRVTDAWLAERAAGRRPPTAHPAASRTPTANPWGRLPGASTVLAAVLIVALGATLIRWDSHSPAPSTDPATSGSSHSGTRDTRTGLNGEPGSQIGTSRQALPHLTAPAAQISTTTGARRPSHRPRTRPGRIQPGSRLAFAPSPLSRFRGEKSLDSPRPLIGPPRRVAKRVPVQDDFVSVPFPRLAAASKDQIAPAVAAYQREAAIVDLRLAQEVTLQEKAVALSDLCQRLQSETGIALKAGPSVADEKVTLFCRRQPLREVMRQLSRPFGYTWLRSGTLALTQEGSTAPPSGSREGGFRYELAQDLKSQLVEEELRNRDRAEALLALDREIQQYRPYLDLSPDEALERARNASPAEKKRLERLAGVGWGVVQLYFRLAPEQLSALRSGESLDFQADAGAGAPRLPNEVATSVLSSLRHRRLLVSPEGIQWGYPASVPTGLPPAQVEGARPVVGIKIHQSELGQFTLEGDSGLTLEHPHQAMLRTSDDARALGPLALGTSPSSRNPNNAASTAPFSRSPALQKKVSVRPAGDPTPNPSRKGRGDYVPAIGSSPPSPSRGAGYPRSGWRGGVRPEPRVTSADVLEALHRATGMPIVADYYTRLYPASELACQDQRLYDALNGLSDAMRLRWRSQGEWLQFRSASYFHDRLKEVPNRLLHLWAAARHERGWLALDELIEIAGLSDAQLDATGMAEGARKLYGLAEWDLARNPNLRPHWRFLATLTPERRKEAGEASLSFLHLTLPQQQEYLRLALGSAGDALSPGLQALSAATLQIDYTVAGWFQWPASPTPDVTPVPLRRPQVRERTRPAALAAARRLDPNVSEADLAPTTLDGLMLYVVGRQGTPRAVRIVRSAAKSFYTD